MSTLPRLFVSDDLLAGRPIPLAEGQAHYLARVMRLGGGDRARVFNGRDGEWEVELAIEGRRVTATPIGQLRDQPTGSIRLTLLFAPLKKTRTDFAIEKAAELGVSVIQPVSTARTQTHRIKIERLEALAIEASEQTERMDIPAVHDLISLDQAIEAWDPSLPLVFCDEAGEDGSKPWGGETGRAVAMADVLSTLSSRAGGVLIGPEGGFSPDERARLRARGFVHAVTLGPRILRAETAIVSALTIWQSVLGDWR